jgi:hypothetical protein
MAFELDKEVTKILESGAVVKTVSSKDGRFGLECVNTVNETTRSIFSRQAVESLVDGFTTLMMGGGTDVPKEWKAVTDGAPVKTEQSKPSVVTLSVEDAEDLLAFAHGKAGQGPFGMYVPTVAIENLTESLSKVKQ